jgi:hypothetical protein
MIIRNFGIHLGISMPELRGSEKVMRLGSAPGQDEGRGTYGAKGTGEENCKRTVLMSVLVDMIPS